MKAKRRNAAGYTPSHAGYASGVQPRPSRSHTHATASANASHGFSTGQTFPSTTWSTTTPSQKIT